jgi:hypothetical protein
MKRKIAGLLMTALITTSGAWADTLNPLPVAPQNGVFQTLAPLKTPKKTADRSEGAADQAPVSLWLPEDVKVVRGAIINPFYLKAVEQEHWRAAARLWDFAVIGANFFGVRDSDYPALLTALKNLAAQSAHPEIENAPLCFVAFSAGSGMSMKFAQLMPERVIAVAPVGLEVGPRDEVTRAIPTLTIFGEKDGRQMEILGANLPKERAQGARWATAVQWGRKHEFAWANNLVIPFFERVIQQRYPAAQNPLQGVPKLLPMDEKSGWLTDGGSWNGNAPRVASFEKYEADKGAAGWLPDAYLAAVWRAFVSKSPGVKITSPAGFGDGQPFATLPAQNPVAVTVEIKGAPQKAQLFDGDNLLGELNAAPFAWNVKLAPGTHSLIAIATFENEVQVSRPATVIVARP